MLLSISITVAGGIAVFLVGLFVFLKKPKGPPNIAFFTLTMLMTGWLLGTAKMFSVCNNPEAVVFWDRIIYIFIVFIPVLFLQLSATFTQGKKLKLIIILGYILGFAFLLLSRSDDFVKGVFQYKYGCHSIAQPLHNVFVMFFVAYVAFFFLDTFLYILRTKNPIKKTQAKYLFLSFVVYTIGIAAFLPAYKISVTPFFFLAELAGTLMMAYAIIKYRLMDIRLVVGKGMVYVFSFLTIIGLGILILFFNNQLAQPISTNIIAFLILIIGIALFTPFFRFYERSVSKYFYSTFYSFENVIVNLTRKLTAVLKLEELSPLIINTLAGTVKLDRTGIVLKDPESGDFVTQSIIGFGQKELLSLAQDKFLISYLEKTKNPLSVEELPWIIEKVPALEEKRNLEKLSQDMRNAKAGLCLPLLIGEKLIGMIILGNKLSGNPYSSQDFDLLTTLSHQAAIAINNAISYEEVRKGKEELEKFYKVTVGREVKMAELKERIKKLEQQMKEKESF